MLQNSPSPKCESRNPPQTICEFRKIHSPPIQFGCSRFQIDAIVLRAIVDHGVTRGIIFHEWLPIALRAILTPSPGGANAT